jgi:hypothetical protein
MSILKPLFVQTTASEESTKEGWKGGSKDVWFFQLTFCAFGQR